MRNKIPILVNTTDSFSDCWEPFFKLFASYWPMFDQKFYLNTEKKDFSYKGFDIVPLKNGSDGNVQKWTNYLLHALDQIPQEIILYMQEDYFLKAPVKENIVDRFVDLMKEKDVSYINFYPYTRYERRKLPYDEDLWYVEKDKPGSFSLQAALWKKSKIRPLIEEYINYDPWKFENKASNQASLCPGDFLCLSHKKYNKQNSPIPYFIAIAKGEWSSEIAAKKHLRDVLWKHQINLKRRKS
jgi:hypothetical protein